MNGRQPRAGDAVVLADPWHPLNRRDASGEPEEWTSWDRDRDGRCEGVSGQAVLRRVGKANSGRVLDGRVWEEFPIPAAQGRVGMVDGDGNVGSASVLTR